MLRVMDDHNHFKRELIHSHMCKRGQSGEKAEQDFILLAQSLPHYGGHFYTATWVIKILLVQVGNGY